MTFTNYWTVHLNFLSEEPEGGLLNGNEKKTHFICPIGAFNKLFFLKGPIFFFGTGNWHLRPFRKVKRENGKLTFIGFLALVRKMSHNFEGQRTVRLDVKRIKGDVKPRRRF